MAKSLNAADITVVRNSSTGVSRPDDTGTGNWDRDDDDVNDLDTWD